MTVTSSRMLTPLVSADLIRSLEARIDVVGNRKQIDVIAPFTGDVIGSIPQASDSDIATAASRAREAQRRWARRTPRDRARVISRFHDILLENIELVIDLVQLEGGKARTSAMEEVYDVAGVSRYYVNTGPGLLRRKRRAVSVPGFTRAYEYHHPVGLVANITPWNFPFMLAISDIVPALIAGNGVILKPDEKTPFSAILGVRLLEESGLPQELIQVVTGEGAPIGDVLVDAADFVTFTGSTEVGRLVSARAGQQLKAVSMELGGKNTALILEDADIDGMMPEIIRAVFTNAGQTCVAMERIHVHESRYEEFASKFSERAAKLPLTADYLYTSALSSLISEDHLESIKFHVEDAVAAGANLRTGGKPRPDVGPLFFEPTVLTDVSESMLLCRGETFGPVVSIYPFSRLDETIAEANNNDLGLNFSVWTSDLDKGIDIASRLEAGTVAVNDGYAAVWSSYDAPMGGMKASGISRRHGAVGLLKYTETQTVAAQQGIPAFAPPFGMSYDTYVSLLKPVLRLLKRLPFYK